MPRKTPSRRPFPTRSQVLDFIVSHQGTVGKREIKRAFSLGAEHRSLLYALMKELKEEGLLPQKRHQRTSTAVLPEVAALEVVAVDADGELLGRPLDWNAAAPPPRIYLLPWRRSLSDVGVGSKVLARLSLAEEGDYNARILKKLNDAPLRIVGVLKTGSRGLMLHPVNRRNKQTYLTTWNGPEDLRPGDLVDAELMESRRFGLRLVRITERLGHMESPHAVSLIAISENGIPTTFSSEALRQADEAAPIPLGSRSDLRSIPLVTIDGEDARDFDDAVWAEKTEDGGWRALIAIADVAAYVAPGSPLDREAYERGNSVYFPDRVVPMLPEALSNGWCSLRPHEDRPCHAVFIWFDSEGNKIRHQFLRGMMRSAARLTYSQVQAALEGTPDSVAAPLLDLVLKPLYGCFKALEKARKKRGVLEIEIPERMVELDAQGAVQAIRLRPQWESHKLIEELMIAANVCAAETLEAQKRPCMYRVHDEPPLERQENLRLFLKSIGLSLAQGAVSASDFNRLLDRVKGKPEDSLVNTVILRAQAQAVYSPENRGHFGLGLRRYAHFTSPIRRYADLLVHRALLGIPGAASPAERTMAAADDALAEIGSHLSQTERRAAAAERDALDRHLARHLSTHVGDSFRGRISGVNRFGLFAELDESGASGLIPLSTLPNDDYFFEQDRLRLVGRRRRISYGLGDVVTVQVQEADPTNNSLLFQLLDERSESPPAGNKKDPHRLSLRPSKTRGSKKERRTKKHP